MFGLPIIKVQILNFHFLGFETPAPAPATAPRPAPAPGTGCESKRWQLQTDGPR